MRLCLFSLCTSDSMLGAKLRPVGVCALLRSVHDTHMRPTCAEMRQRTTTIWLITNRKAAEYNYDMA